MGQAPDSNHVRAPPRERLDGLVSNASQPRAGREGCKPASYAGLSLTSRGTRFNIVINCQGDLLVMHARAVLLPVRRAFCNRPESVCTAAAGACRVCSQTVGFYFEEEKTESVLPGRVGGRLRQASFSYVRTPLGSRSRCCGSLISRRDRPVSEQRRLPAPLWPPAC